MTATTPVRKYHFISGLPRAGSTLLAAILNQNPRFRAGMTSPLADIMGVPAGPDFSRGTDCAAWSSASGVNKVALPVPNLLRHCS